jgi:hypothetical protein
MGTDWIKEISPPVEKIPSRLALTILPITKLSVSRWWFLKPPTGYFELVIKEDRT